MSKRRRRGTAAEVDWSREPRGAREAALRAAYLDRCLAEGSLGWIELLCLALEQRRRPADLAAAAAEAERLLAERVAARRRAGLRAAERDAGSAPISERVLCLATLGGNRRGRPNDSARVRYNVIGLSEASHHSKRLFAAAECLYEGTFYGQAVARAYYSVYAMTHYLALRHAHWRWAQYRSGQPKPSPAHNDTEMYVRWSLEEYRVSMPPREGQRIAKELVSQRVAADYYGYQDIPSELAARLLGDAAALRIVLLDVARSMENAPVRPGF